MPFTPSQIESHVRFSITSNSDAIMLVTKIGKTREIITDFNELYIINTNTGY